VSGYKLIQSIRINYWPHNMAHVLPEHTRSAVPNASFSITMKERAARNYVWTLWTLQMKAACSLAPWGISNRGTKRQNQPRHPLSPSPSDCLFVSTHTSCLGKCSDVQKILRVIWVIVTEGETGYVDYWCNKLY